MAEKQERILIVDDEAMARRLINAKLSSEGYHCHQAASAKQALEELKKNSIDLVILDILMPGKSGMQFLPVIKERYPDIPVIMAAAITDINTSIQCIRQGAYDYVTKPFNLDELVMSIERALEMRRLKLIEYGEQYRIVFESANDVLLFLDRHGKILDVNDRLKEIGGYEKEDFVGKNIRSLTKLMSKRSLARVLKNFLKRMAGFNVQPYEVEMFTKNGESLTIEINAVAIRRESKIIGDLVILRDITERKSIEEKLQESEARYRSVFENAYDMIQSIAPDGSFIFVNSAWLKTLGYTELDLAGLNIFDIIHPDSLPHCQELFAKVMDGESVKNLQVTFVAKDGSKVQVEGSASPRIIRGKTVATQGIFHDVTERKKTEHSIEERIKELRCLYGISRIITQPGISLDELMKGTIDIIPLGWQYPEITCARIVLNDRVFETSNFVDTKWKQSADIIINNKKRGTVYAYYLEERADIDEGPFLKEERDLINGIARMLSEVIERKEAGELLRNSEEQNRLLLDSAGEAIYGLDINGICTFANKACLRVLGYDSETYVLGKNMHDLIHYQRPDGTPYPNEECRIYQAFRHGEGVYVDNEVLWCSDGSSFPAEYWSYLMHQGDEVVGAVVVFTNITDRRQAEEEKREIELQLRESRKMEAVGRLAGGVAHDFNNLLTVITVGSEMLLDDLDKDDPKRQDVEEIVKATERATSLTQQLLTFSRRQVLEPSVLDINSIVRDMDKMLHRLIGENIQLETILEPKLCNVKADRGNIEQVIMNMVLNARDAMPGGGKIIVRTECIILDEGIIVGISEAKPDKFIRLSITDTGIGIDEKTKEHIFEPFFTTKAKGQGTGLGLSTVYGIVKQNDGWINVYSELGQGSTFRVYLPAFSGSSEGKSEMTKETTSLGELRGNGERILLVEDDELILAVAQQVLTENGYIVFITESAEEALTIFDREDGNFQLVLSDVVLPGKSGVELVGQLLALQPELHILLSSGYADEKFDLSAIQDKGYSFLQKPYTIEKLLRSVKENIARTEGG